MTVQQAAAMTEAHISSTRDRWQGHAEYLGYDTVGDMLHDMYHGRRMSILEMADTLGYAPETVRYQMVSYGIGRRKTGRSRKGER